ncbi:MAG: hypothetical protein ACREA0_00750 [bacterium]
MAPSSAEKAVLGLVDLARGHALPVDEERALAALAHASALIGELVADGRLPSRQRLAGAHRVLVQAQPVVGVGRLAVLQVETPAAEVGGLGQDHAVSRRLRDLDRFIGGETNQWAPLLSDQLSVPSLDRALSTPVLGAYACRE